MRIYLAQNAAPTTYALQVTDALTVSNLRSSKGSNKRRRRRDRTSLACRWRLRLVDGRGAAERKSGEHE